MSLSDWFATVGVSLLLLAYVLDVFNFTPDDSDLFLTLNAIGAALAGVGAWMASFWPFVVLEGVWTAVSLFALARKRLKR